MDDNIKRLDDQLKSEIAYLNGLLPYLDEITKSDVEKRMAILQDERKTLTT